MKITDEVFQVGGGEYSSAEDAAVYLMNPGGHAALVDAGCGYATDRILKNIHACGVRPDQIEYLLITHCHFDHVGGADLLRQKTGCKIVAHALDAKFLETGDNEVTAASWYGASLEPFRPDIILLAEKQEIPLGDRLVRAIHTPGHSPGSVVYLVESCGFRVLFGQDVHGPLHPGFLSNREEYLKSLRLLLALEPDILCEGHFGVFRGKKKCADFIGQFIN